MQTEERVWGAWMNPQPTTLAISGAAVRVYTLTAYMYVTITRVLKGRYDLAHRRGAGEASQRRKTLASQRHSEHRVADQRKVLVSDHAKDGCKQLLRHTCPIGVHRQLS